MSQLALQRIMHLPHHGLPPALLRSRPSLGDTEYLPLDVHISATRALASVRLFPIAQAMFEYLHREVARSGFRPLESLSKTAAPLQFTLSRRRTSLNERMI